ncbi:MAG: HNH endonuclease family protein, partial [Chloroflexi bacterium]|nr:HNH endonuclease family protein [Chloroflexota bacterium]
VPLAISTQEEILTSDYEVEHVWAQNPARSLSEIEETQHKESVHKLGNLTIASKAWNISMGNKPFEDKKTQPDDRPSYSNSSLQVQKTLAEQTMWDAGTISEREDRLVEFALKRWTI